MPGMAPGTAGSGLNETHVSLLLPSLSIPVWVADDKLIQFWMVLSALGKAQHHNGWSVVESGALCPTTWSRKPCLQNSMNLGGRLPQECLLRRWAVRVKMPKC